MSLNKRSTDFTTKYFDNAYFTPVLSEKALIELIISIIEKIIVSMNLPDNTIKDTIKEIQYSEVLQYSKHELTSIRKVKAFKKILERNYQKIKNDINFADTMLISIVESNRLELYNFIKINYSELAISPSDIESFSNLFTSTFFEQKTKRLSSLLSKYQLNEEDLEFLFTLFPHIKEIIEAKPKEMSDYTNLAKKISEAFNKAEEGKRISHFYLIARLIAPERIDKAVEYITSQSFKNEIIMELDKSVINYFEYSIKLSQLFPHGIENSGLRRISLNWIHSIITSSEYSEILARNFVIVLSFIANTLSNTQGYFSNSEKKSASFIVWDYCKRKDSKKSILLKVLAFDNNSDAFADTVLFYSIHKERTPGGVIIQDNLIYRVALCYLKRLNGKLEKGSIFDDNIFDDILATIWRWWQAINYLMDNNITLPISIDFKTYLPEELTKSTTGFKMLFDPYIIQDFPDEDATFRPEGELDKIISKEEIIKLIQYHYKENRLVNFTIKRREALIRWANNQN